MNGTANLEITKLVTHKLQLALADDSVSPTIKKFIQKILNNEVKLVELETVLEGKNEGRMIYKLSDSTSIIFDASDDEPYHDCAWQEVLEGWVDGQWKVSKHTSYLALTDCLVYLAASFEQ